MKLNEQSLQEKGWWQEHHIALPRYDRAAVREATKSNPSWLHFGPGNIFRAFIAAVQQRVLNEGKAETGIIAAAPHSREAIDAVYRPHDDLSLMVTMKADETKSLEVIGSVVESLDSNPGSPDWQALEQIAAAPSLEIISFTITEKGYKAASGQSLAAPADTMGKVTALLYKRYCAGGQPVTLLSLDNCSHNGSVLKAGILKVAEEWNEQGNVPEAFLSYLQERISYPWTMIDKITPRPSNDIAEELKAMGFEDMGFVQSKRGSFYAPFVNAEECGYLVIEDDFRNGRPALEAGSVIFTDRETVEKVERMKVCACLNPLHTALAVYGCLLGYHRISDEMSDPDLKRLVVGLGAEGIKVVEDPVVLKPEVFLRECLESRFPNAAIPDTPQRIATDTSQKVGIRYGETIKAYAKLGKASELTYIPWAIAGWCRYLMGVDDQGEAMPLSPDPLLASFTEQLKAVELGKPADVHAVLAPILSDTSIFGSDLYEAGIGEMVEHCFAQLILGKGAVRAALQA